MSNAASALGIDFRQEVSTSPPGLIEGLRVLYFGGVDVARPRTSDSVLVDDGAGHPQPVAAFMPSNPVATLVACTFTDERERMPRTQMAFVAVPTAIEPLEPASLLSASDKELLRGASNALLASPLYVSLKH